MRHKILAAFILAIAGAAIGTTLGTAGRYALAGEQTVGGVNFPGDGSLNVAAVISPSAAEGAGSGVSVNGVSFFPDGTIEGGFHRRDICHIRYHTDEGTISSVFLTLPFQHANCEELIDSANWHTFGANDTRITPGEGLRMVTANILWDSNATGRRRLLLSHYNSSSTRLRLWETTTDPNLFGSDPALTRISTVINFDAGDYVEFDAYQTSGAGLDIRGHATGNGSASEVIVMEIGGSASDSPNN